MSNLHDPMDFPMNTFDTRSLLTLSHLTFQSHFATHAVMAIVNDYIFKGVVLIALLWWLWFQPGERAQRNRECVIVGIVGGALALALGRLMAHYLPFRLRPMYNPELRGMFSFTGLHEPMLRTWSSFPSDHAMLWCAIATSILLASWRMGIYAWLHAALLVCLPRVIVGLHYPSDVLVGAALGAVVACVLGLPAVRARVAAPVLAIERRIPAVFYALAFVLSFELATQFDELRELAHGLAHVL